MNLNAMLNKILNTYIYINISKFVLFSENNIAITFS